MNRAEIILGIDPGYERIGIAILKKENGKENLTHSECFETDNKLSHPERLHLISSHLKEIIGTYKPDKMAVETILWSKNSKTALKVAEARGVVMSLAAEKGVEVYEFNPNSIKLAVTGYGKSEKKQVMKILEKILKINRPIKFDDEYDAIAAALTCAVTQLSTKKKAD